MHTSGLACKSIGKARNTWRALGCGSSTWVTQGVRVPVKSIRREAGLVVKAFVVGEAPDRISARLMAGLVWGARWARTKVNLGIRGNHFGLLIQKPNKVGKIAFVLVLDGVRGNTLVANIAHGCVKEVCRIEVIKSGADTMAHGLAQGPDVSFANSLVILGTFALGALFVRRQLHHG